MNNQVQQALAITKAIAYTENGGKPNIKNPKAGKTGETKSIFQFEPATWDAYSKQIFGKTVPENPDTETVVVVGKVSKWLQQGLTPQQIFSSWNAGPGEPNAYQGTFSDGTSSAGINEKYGVAYNVPKYVATAENYMKSFLAEDQNNSQSNQQIGNTQTSTQQTMKSGQSFGNKGGIALQNMLALAQQAQARGKPQQQLPQGGLLTSLAPQTSMPGASSA